MRKIINIQMNVDEYNDVRFLALCDDGTAWYQDSREYWLQIVDVPQTPEGALWQAKHSSEDKRWMIGKHTYQNFEARLAAAMEKAKQEKETAAATEKAKQEREAAARAAQEKAE